jgi:hypothetical protein
VTIRLPRIRRLVSIAVVTLAVLAVVSTSASAATAPPGTPVAHPTAGDPTIAAVFRDGLAAGHECTASVVRSARRNLLIGAAHCFSGTVRGVQLVPGYSDGHAPYGVWTVTGAYVDREWKSRLNPQRDWVFLTVAPQLRDGRAVQIQDVTGANLPLFSLAEDRPIGCIAVTYRYQGYGAFNCDGYVGGTSGSPWLVSTPLGRAVAGVIGGLHQGGCVNWTSYSAPLGLPAWVGYLRASMGEAPDTLPSPGGDGC